MIEETIKFLLNNLGSVPGTIALIVLGAFLYFDWKYKKKLEENHFESIKEQFQDINGLIKSNQEKIESKFNAAFTRIDELKMYDHEFSKQMVDFKVRFDERTKSMADDICRLNNKVFNGVRG